MVEEEYELLPHKEIEELKKQLEILKKKPDSLSGVTTVNMEQLNKSLNEFLNILKDASKEMKAEGDDKESLSQKMEKLIGKLDEVVDQNEKIAEGLVSIAEMVSDFTKGKKPEPKPQQSPSPGFGSVGEITKPSFGEVSAPGSAPPPASAGSMPPPASAGNMPPPPMPPPKKKGLFHR